MSDQALNPKNPGLHGHKLVLVRFEAPPVEYIERTKKQYPGLEVVYHELKDRTDTYVPDSVWENATILLTFNVFPTPEQAPKLQYVQLSSAGANHVHGTPLYEKADVAFCTANGVHP